MPENPIEPLNDSRSEHDERLTVFGYYAAMGAAQFPAGAAETLIATGYRDPREVLRELSDWCYSQRVLP